MNKENEACEHGPMTREELTKELAKRFGGHKVYSKFFTADHPPAEIFFHKDTGFSIGIFRLDTKKAFLSDEGKLQASYRIDKTPENEAGDL
jgi:hypothetical protein